MEPKVLRDRLWGYLSVTYHSEARLNAEEFRDALESLEALTALAQNHTNGSTK